jgi:hypothetical protein
MMSYFDIRDFSQLVDKASIYEESLKENAAEYADQKRDSRNGYFGRRSRASQEDGGGEFSIPEATRMYLW